MNAPSYLLFYISTTLLYGCVSFSPASYPESWEELANTDNIEQRIVGNYHCEGQTLRPSNLEIIDDAAFLPQLLQINNVKPTNCETVKLSQIKKGELEVTVIKDAAIIETKKLFEGIDYHKSSGWVVLKKSEGGVERESFMIFAGGMRGKDSFTITKSGDLIVKSSFVAAAWAVIIPVAGYGATWSKFDRQPY